MFDPKQDDFGKRYPNTDEREFQVSTLNPTSKGILRT